MNEIQGRATVATSAEHPAAPAESSTASGAQPEQSALTIKGGKGDVTFEVHAAERVVHDVLDWSHGNQIEFLAVIALVAFAVYQNRLSKRERDRDRLEFDKVRADIRKLRKDR